MDVELAPRTDSPNEDTPPRPRLTGRAWFRPTALAIGGVLVLFALASVAAGRDEDPVRSGDSTLDAWVPYWALDDAAPEFAANARRFREISPFWFAAVGPDLVAPDANIPAGAAARVLDSARANGVAVVPSIRDALPAGEMAAILGDPALRSRHVAALVGFAAEGDYDGLDLDYEQFAFADDRTTWTTTATAWIAFLGELGPALRAAGRTLTVSVPPVYDGGRGEASGYWVYDYAAMAPLVDRIRIMAYDYSTATPGPISPIDWVRDLVAAASAVTGTPEKLVLGVPLYGYNWVTSVSGTCPADAETGRTTVTQRSVTDLIVKRAAAPVWDEATDEWSFSYALELTDGSTTCLQQRTVQYVDEAGARARIAVAEQAGFGGAALWGLGYEAPTWWTPVEPLGS